MVAIKGFVEAVTPEGVRGWAYDPTRSDAHLEISVSACGVEIASGIADQPRADLLAAGIARGDHGFTLSFANDLNESQILTLAVHAGSPALKVAIPALRAEADLVGNEASDRSVPMKDEAQHPVFVLGPARSGTSAVALALLKCGRYEGFGEGHLVPLAGELIATVHRFYQAGAAAAQEGTLLRRVPTLTFEIAIRRSFVQLSRTLFPTGYWLDKTPTLAAVYSVPLISEIWPKARFIFMRRRVLENLASRMRKFPGERLQDHYKDWAAVLQAWAAVRHTVEDRSLEIEHLDLASRPEETAADIARFLGLESDSAARLSASLSADRPQQTSATLGLVTSLDAFGLSAAEQGELRAACDPTMELYGYSYDGGYFAPALRA